MSIYNVGTIFDREELAAISEAIMSQVPLTRGALVYEFEEALKAFLGASYVTACSSGSAALRLVYQALGLQFAPQPVIVQVNSFWNTLAPLVEFSCPIKFVDC